VQHAAGANHCDLKAHCQLKACSMTRCELKACSMQQARTTGVQEANIKKTKQYQQVLVGGGDQ
jgi:hypothetical protein